MKNNIKNLISTLLIGGFLLSTCVENHLLPDFAIISIFSDPVGAEIYLDGENTGKVTPDSLDELLGGNYNIELKYEEFKDTAFAIQIGENQNVSYDIFMKEIDPAGSITLRSDPSGAEIFLDGENTGQKTPAEFSDLERGIYQFALKLDLYDDSEFQISLDKDEIVEKNTRMIIAGTSGAIFVSSTPSGAKIFLDDFDTGLVTPDTLNPLAVGTYDIKLSLENYRDSTVTVNVNQGTVTFANVNLTLYEPRGSIYLTSDPSGARIYLDDVDQEIFTPNLLGKLEAGDYLIKLTLADYFDTVFTVPVTADQRTNWPTIQMEKIPYYISVDIDPENGGTVTGSGGYNEGDKVTLIATPSIGFEFVNWTEDGSFLSNNSQYEFTATKDRNLTANFKLKTYVISAETSPLNAGLISGTGEYTHGDIVELSFTAFDGFRFVNWTENGEEVSTSETYSFTADSDRNLLLNFDPIGNLMLDSDPIGADIYLNGIYSGQQTPQTFENLLAGEYSVELKLDYFADTTITTDIFAGETTNLGTIVLTDTTSEVEVTVTHEVRSNGRLFFYFTFNQDVRFDWLYITTPTNVNFSQPYGGTLYYEGVQVDWSYAEKISGEWSFNFQGRKANGRQAEFDFNETHQVD